MGSPQLACHAGDDLFALLGQYFCMESWGSPAHEATDNSRFDYFLRFAPDLRHFRGAILRENCK